MAAAPIAPTRPRATKNTRPYNAALMPVSRTPDALVAKVLTSRSRRPKSLTIIAPATLKRSLICVFICALSSICSRAMPPNFRPIRFAGAMNNGRTTKESNVNRHSRTNIAAKVVMSTTTLETTLPKVDVTAVCAPTTSLLRRLISAPVCVRVKNAMGIRCTLSNSATRRS